MRLGDLLDKSAKDSLAGACVPNNTRPRSAQGPPDKGAVPTRPTGQDARSLVKRLEDLHYGDALQYFYENQEEFGVYSPLSYRECAQIIGAHLSDISRPARSRWTGKPVEDSADNDHPKYEYRRKSRRGQRPSGSYRVDQLQDSKDIWLSDKMVRSIKGLT